MISISFNRFACAALGVVALAALCSCSSDDSPVATTSAGNAAIPRPRVTYENPTPPPVRINDIQCFPGGSAVVCSYNGVVALYQSAGGWRMLNTGRSVSMNALWGTSDTDFYVAGDRGCILHWDGTAFTEIHAGVVDDLTNVWGSATDDVWFCGYNGLVHWDGSTVTVYNSTDLPLSGFYYDIGGSSSSNVYVIASFGRVLHWDGTSWAPVTTGLGSVQLNSIYVTGDEVFIAAENKILWHYDGAAWSSFTATSSSSWDDFLAITGTGPNRVYAFGQDRLMYRWDGSAWSDISDPFFDSSYWIQAACAVGPSIGVGGDYRSGSTNLARYDGTAWTSMVTAQVPETALWDAWTFQRDNAYAVGDGGTIIHRDASGWSAVPHGLTSEDLYAMWASGPSNLYAVGGNGTVLNYDGTSWAPVNTGLGTATLFDISGGGANNLWILGSEALWHWDGASWSDHWSEVPNQNLYYTGIYVAPGGDVFLTGENIAHFDGSNWTSASIKLGNFTYAEHTWATSANNIWLSNYSSIVQWDGTNANVRWSTSSYTSYVIAGRSADNILAGVDGELVQFAAGVPNVTPLTAGTGVNGAHTGADGTTYFVGYDGLIVRVE